MNAANAIPFAPVRPLPPESDRAVAQNRKMAAISAVRDFAVIKRATQSTLDLAESAVVARLREGGSGADAVELGKALIRTNKHLAGGVQ